MSFFTATTPLRSPSTVGNVIQSTFHSPTAASATRKNPFPSAGSNIVGYHPISGGQATVAMQTRCLSTTPMTMARIKSHQGVVQDSLPVEYGGSKAKFTRKTHDLAAPMHAPPSSAGAASAAGSPKTNGPTFNINPFEAVGMVPGGVTMEWGQDGALRVVPQKAKYTGGGKQSSIKPVKASVASAQSPDTPSRASIASGTDGSYAEKRAYGSVPPIPNKTPIMPDVRKGSLDAMSSPDRRRPAFRIDIPAPPSAASLLRGFQHRITPITERKSEAMMHAPSQSGPKLLNLRRAGDNKDKVSDNYVILGVEDHHSTYSEAHGREMHDVAVEYKAAKGMGMGYSLNRRVSTPWTKQESDDWMGMNREDSMDSLTEESDLWVLRNTMGNARI